MTPSVTSAPKLHLQGTAVHLTREDITELEVDGFVYYAEPKLALGSGFGGAIAVRGGASIQKELNSLAEAGPVPVGKVVVTGSGKLKAHHIIHAVGPRFREEGTAEKLRETVLNCLGRANEIGMRTLAFPLMGAGYYGIPPAVSARVMLDAFREHVQQETGLEEIVISVLDTPQFNAVESAIADMG